MQRHTAVYARTSTVRQELRSQLPDLKRWLAAFSKKSPAIWYQDQESGRKMQRPGWTQLEEALRVGAVERVVVWRMDRLGRTAAGLTALFEELRSRKVPLVSIRDGFDLFTPAGHMMATVLASVAQYETEVRSERQAAGIAAAKASGKRWGGRVAGIPYKATAEVARQVLRMVSEGEGKAAVARVTGLSRQTIYRILSESGEGGKKART